MILWSVRAGGLGAYVAQPWSEASDFDLWPHYMFFAYLAKDSFWEMEKLSRLHHVVCAACIIFSCSGYAAACERTQGPQPMMLPLPLRRALVWGHSLFLLGGVVLEVGSGTYGLSCLFPAHRLLSAVSIWIMAASNVGGVAIAAWYVYRTASLGGSVLLVVVVPLSIIRQQIINGMRADALERFAVADSKR